MRIVVTGANGFVGRAVLAQLAVHGHEAVPVVRSPSNLAGEYVAEDLSVRDLPVDILQGADALVHLVARTHVTEETAADPLAEYRRVNVEGTRNALNAVISSGVRRFVLMSSVKAVGEWSLPSEPLTPVTAPRPEDPYGLSKLEAENLVRERCERDGVEWVILRPPLVYGPGVGANFEKLVRLVARQLPLPFGAIRNRRTLVHVDGLADAVVRAATLPQAAGHIFMVGDVTMSTPEMVRAISRALGIRSIELPVPVPILQLLGKLAGKGDLVQRLTGSLELDSSATCEVLHWRPEQDFAGAMVAIGRAMGIGNTPEAEDLHS